MAKRDKRKSDLAYLNNRIAHTEQRIEEMRHTRANLNAETDPKIIPLLDEAIRLMVCANENYIWVVQQDRKNRGDL